MFKFKTTEELQPIEYLIGQDRALSSINFALDIKVDGYNLYVSGIPGSGRTSSIRKIVEEKAKNEKTPDDIIYVYNFKNPDRPNLIKFPAGRGNFFAKDIDELISTIIKTIPKAFEAEDYEKRRNEVVKRFQIEKEKLIEQVDAMAKEKGFLIQFAPNWCIDYTNTEWSTFKPEDLLNFLLKCRKKFKKRVRSFLKRLMRLFQN